MEITLFTTGEIELSKARAPVLRVQHALFLECVEPLPSITSHIRTLQGLRYIGEDALKRWTILRSTQLGADL